MRDQLGRLVLHCHQEYRQGQPAHRTSGAPLDARDMSKRTYTTSSDTHSSLLEFDVFTNLRICQAYYSNVNVLNAVLTNIAKTTDGQPANLLRQRITSCSRAAWQLLLYFEPFRREGGARNEMTCDSLQIEFASGSTRLKLSTTSLETSSAASTAAHPSNTCHSTRIEKK